MKHACVGCLFVVLAVMLAPPASAQEKGQVGIAMGYPASVGVVWQVADRFAIRPEVSLAQGATSSTSTTTLSLPTVIGSSQVQTTQTQLTVNNTTVGAGVSGLFYFLRREALTAFVSPRYSYSRGSNTTTASGVGVQATEGTVRSHFMSGSFGAQYALARRFSVFGEIGIGYSHGTTSTPPSSSSVSPVVSASSSSEGRSHTVSTRSGAGVVFYFR